MDYELLPSPHLTPDIWEHVCRFLSYGSILALSHTCKSIHRALSSRQKIYRRLLIKYFKDHDIKQISREIKCKHITYKDYFRDLYFRGAYVSYFRSMVPLCPGNLIHIDSDQTVIHYALLTRKPFMWRQSCKRVNLASYVCNTKKGLCLVNEIPDPTGKSPRVSVGIMDHPEKSKFLKETFNVARRVLKLIATEHLSPWMDESTKHTDKKETIYVGLIKLRYDILTTCNERVKAGEDIISCRLVYEGPKITAMYFSNQRYQIALINNIPLPDFFNSGV